MAQHNELGVQGEADALAYLIKQGYVIKAKNWRFGKEEIDLIAENDACVAIVEVKARTTDTFGNPEDFINKGKQRHLIKAANAYAEEFNVQKDIHFDVIAITYKPEFLLEHIKEAFYP